MASPTLSFTTTIIQPGANLRVEGEGTSNITAIYDDNYAPGGVTFATCYVNISYSNVQWTLNPDNSVTVTGTINSDSLKRVPMGSSLGYSYYIQTWFNSSRTFERTVPDTPSSPYDLYDLNFPSTFSITVAPQTTSTAASIEYKSEPVNFPQYAPDWFTVGLVVTNPNTPDYRPGKVFDKNAVWQSHNRDGGAAGIRNDLGLIEMRTVDGGTGTGNPPLIRNASGFVNQRKVGAE